MLENKQLILKYDEMLNVPYLSFFFEIPHAKKTEEVKLVLELDKKVLNQKEGNDFILKEINELKKEVKELKEENKNLKIIIEKNKENSNDAIKENLEAIINVLIDEKLKEKNDNKNNENRSNISNNTNINKMYSYFIFHEKYLQLIAYQRWTFPKIIYSKKYPNS